MCKQMQGNTMKWHPCGCVHVFVCVVKERVLMWARTFVAAVTSRGQCESLQFLQSSFPPHDETTAESTNTDIWFLVVFPVSIILCPRYSNSKPTHGREMLSLSAWENEQIRPRKRSFPPRVVFAKSLFVCFCVPTSPTLLFPPSCDWT